MKLKDISRTATFAWDLSSSSSPWLATGAVAGALDESFSNESQLEIWAPDFGEGQGVFLGGEGKPAVGSITVNSRFNRLAWSAPSTTHSRGVLASGLETGEINVYDPEKIVAGNSADEARLFTSSKHSGPVRGLDFNPLQKNLLLSGAVNAELFIYDLNNPSNPIPPGAASKNLGEITSLQWNPTVSRIFAASSSSGFTSVYDLKAQKEIVSLQYGGGAAKGMGTVGSAAGLQMGKRRGMSDVCWHPEQATRLITASEDDESPIIMLWDLRNTRAPERILSGHNKGVLSVSWCRQDADLLLSCGKDNRTLCWNPQTGEIIGELPASSDWSFQTSWCPRNPDLLATASFDGHIGIHSLQTTRTPEPPVQNFREDATADDIFGALGNEGPIDQTENVLSLKQPPRWLRRPVSATFGFGGLLASTSNLPGANGKHQSGVVHIRPVITEQSIVDRATALHETQGSKDLLSDLCDGRAGQKTDTSWKTLQTLFKANSKEELVQLLGFSKEDVVKQVEEAIAKLPTTKSEEKAEKPNPAVTFVEPETEDAETELGTTEADRDAQASSQAAENTPSEVSVTSDTTKRTEATELTEQSLFDNETPGTPSAAAADFFSSMASGTLRNPRLDNVIPHKAEVAESSVAATVGSRASSVRSDIIKDNTFHIYPSGENDVDRLITQALVLGDFGSAVDLCLASERYADALLLAVRGGPELLQNTQKAYFAKRTTSLPFLRVFQSIVTEDLVDIVQCADLGEWKVIFVVLCTFAKDSDFNNLADQLGQRLQFRWQMLSNSDSSDAKIAAKEARENATLCYLAARRLEKVVTIWIEEMREEEEASDAPRYTAHAQALQSFIEKVAIFSVATGYVDQDLASPTESAAAAEAGARSYRLAGLYDRFYEYADLLAAQGLIDVAAGYVRKTPPDYRGTGAAGSELDKARDRLFQAADISEAGPFKQAAMSSQGNAGSRVPAPSTYTPAGAVPASNFSATGPPNGNGYGQQSVSYQPPSLPQQNVSPQSQSYGASNAYAPLQTSVPAYAPQQQSYQATPSPYGPPASYGVPDARAQGYGNQPNPYSAPTQQATLGPPPRAGTHNDSSATPPPVPAAQRRDLPGWNDAPKFAPPKRPQSVAKTPSKAAPIMSPFPNAQDPLANAGSQYAAQQGIASPPPPPRSAQPGMLPPPPKGGPRPPSAQSVARASSQQQPHQPPQGRSPPQLSGSTLQPVGGPPPQHVSGPPPSFGVPPAQRGPVGRGGPPPPGVIAGPPPRALSPLGPGGRAMPALTAQVQPPPQSPPQGGARAFSPLGQGVPAGARIGGPPPPGVRPPSAQSMNGAMAPNPPTVPMPAQAPPAKTLHPAGDRSHIPSSSKPIFDILSSEINRVKVANLPPHVKRIADDTDRRLNILFDQLNNDSVPRQTLDQLQGITKAISAKDVNTALALHVDLLTNATGEMTAWVPGVKQLIRLGV